MLTIVLRVVLAIVLRVVLSIVLLWVVSLLRFLSIASEWDPGKAPGRWRGVLGRVALLLRSVDEGHVGPCDPPSPVYGVNEEDRKDNHETGDGNGDTRSGAQSIPANDIPETNGEGRLRSGRGKRGASGLADPL